MNEYPSEPKPIVYPVSACCPIENTQLVGVISADTRHYSCGECGCAYTSTEKDDMLEQASAYLETLRVEAKTDPVTRKKLIGIVQAAQNSGVLLDDICQHTQV
jgi:hypothetical protein